MSHDCEPTVTVSNTGSRDFIEGKQSVLVSHVTPEQAQWIVRLVEVAFAAAAIKAIDEAES